jgi:hypothetical protein
MKVLCSPFFEAHFLVRNSQNITKKQLNNTKFVFWNNLFRETIVTINTLFQELYTASSTWQADRQACKL